MTHPRPYAVKRVQRLKSKLEMLHALPFDGEFKGRPVQKQIDSTKGALRHWLRLYPDIDHAFLLSITHGRG